MTEATSMRNQSLGSTMSLVLILGMSLFGDRTVLITQYKS